MENQVPLKCRKEIQPLWSCLPWWYVRPLLSEWEEPEWADRRSFFIASYLFTRILPHWLLSLGNPRDLEWGLTPLLEGFQTSQSLKSSPTLPADSTAAILNFVSGSKLFLGRPESLNIMRPWKILSFSSLEIFGNLRPCSIKRSWYSILPPIVVLTDFTGI